MAKSRYRHLDLREALIDTAEALVRELGVNGWSVRETSSRIGVDPGAAYYHFASRDGLARAVSERVFARLAVRLRRAAARAGDEAAGVGPERLVAVGRSYVRWAVEDPAVARLAFGVGVGVTDSETTGTIDSFHPRDVFAAELDRLVEAGGLAAAARPGAELVVWAAVHGLAILLIDGLIRLDGPEAAEAEAERLVRAVLTGLAREPEPAPL
jgi:AcrR family transcriptional regulator